MNKTKKIITEQSALLTKAPDNPFKSSIWKSTWFIIVFIIMIILVIVVVVMFFYRPAAAKFNPFN